MDNSFIHGYLWVLKPPDGKRFPHQMETQIHFDPESMKVLGKNGSIPVLTLYLDQEYKLVPHSATSPTFSEMWELFYPKVHLNSSWAYTQGYFSLAEGELLRDIQTTLVIIARN